MNLFILRHGLAVEHGTPGYADDASRPARGIRAVPHMHQVCGDDCGLLAAGSSEISGGDSDGNLGGDVKRAIRI